MKKIAYLIPSYPVLSETFIGTEMRAMQRLGHEIVPIAFRRHEGPSQPHDQQLADQTTFFTDLTVSDAFRYLSSWQNGFFSGVNFALRQTGMSRKSLLYAAAKIASVVAREDCQHIHAHFAQATAATAIVVARLLGISVSFVGHGYDVYATPADLALKLNAVDLAVAVCKDMETDFQILAPTARTGRVYCGIEPGRFSPPLHEPVCNGRLLFIGRLCETKGISDLIQAISRIPIERRPPLDIIGEGILEKTLKAQAGELDLYNHVHFLGWKTADWIAENGPSYLGLVGAFRPAENGDRDTGPVVVKEAMAMGLPVVTTNFMGCKEMVTPETGYQVPVGAIDRLANALQSLCSLTPEARSRMKTLARERVLKYFTADLQANKLSGLIQRL